MKAHIKPPYDQGLHDGCYRALAAMTLAVHNLYNWGDKPIRRLSEEAIRILNAAQDNPDAKFELEQYIKRLEDVANKPSGGTQC